ncbi:MAG: gliding motility-associated C-terminal domain-containing protein, partial [Flavobacteriales bacterium]|nr:gliding motility-associated C-terminal domain-containing protein [Flavobacteriales bacterium]
DGLCDAQDGCPADPNKTAPGICGCGVADTDTDLDGMADCNDGCPNDPNKIAAGICGCGVADTDGDSDGTADCNDGCPTDPNKTAPGTCGCGVADTDGDGDGTADCNDGCPTDPNKIAPGTCGCGVADTDTDGDGTANCNDGCPADPDKIAPGICGCGTADADSDGDGLADCVDDCPGVVGQIGSPCDDLNDQTINDAIGADCQCAGIPVDCDDNDPCTIDSFVGTACVNTPAADTDADGACDLIDGCPTDPNKIDPGVCGCGESDADTDQDGTADCIDGCPTDPNKIAPGVCGCSVPDTDSDGDGIADCSDDCPNLPGQIGSLCDDDDVETVNDVISPDCVCIGTDTTTCVVPTIVALASDVSICSADQLNLEVEAVGTGPLVYAWSGEGDFINGNNGASTTIENAQSGIYTVSISNGCGTIEGEVSVTVSQPPSAAWSAPAILCSNHGPLDLNGLVQGASGGLWSGPFVSGSVFDPLGQPGSSAISYTVSSGGCTSSEEHTIQVSQGPNAVAGPDDVTCALQYELQAQLDVVPGEWSGPAGASFNDANSPNTTVVVPSNGVYTFTWTVGDGVCTASDTVLITFQSPNEPAWADAGPDQVLDGLTTTTLTGGAPEGSDNTWSVVSGTGVFEQSDTTSTMVTGLSIGQNIFTLTNSFGSGCEAASDTVVITVSDFFVPQGFSPNGDGSNDLFVISGLLAFPSNELRIFNRWGQEVNAFAPYDNSWSGLGANGHSLPDDTYFYVLNLTPDRTYNGFVVIKR